MTDAPFPILAIASGTDRAGHRVVLATDQSGILAQVADSDAFTRVRSGGITTAIAVSPDCANDSLAVVGIAGGAAISHDAGRTWTDEPIADLFSPVASIAIGGLTTREPVVLVASLEDGVFQRSPGGSWRLANTGLPLSRTNVVRFDETGTAWLGTEAGLFFSPTGGRSWRDDLAAEIDAEITAIAVAGDVVAFGTATGAVFSLRPEPGELTHICSDTHGAEVLALDLTPEHHGVVRLAAVSAGTYQCWRVPPDRLGPAEVAGSLPLPGDVTCASFDGPSQRRTMLLGRANGAIDLVAPGPDDSLS